MHTQCGALGGQVRHAAQCGALGGQASHAAQCGVLGDQVTHCGALGGQVRHEGEGRGVCKGYSRGQVVGEKHDGGP